MPAILSVYIYAYRSTCTFTCISLNCLTEVPIKICYFAMSHILDIYIFLFFPFLANNKIEKKGNYDNYSLDINRSG